MKHTRDKLSEYGLSFDIGPYSTTGIQQKIFRANNDESKRVENFLWHCNPSVTNLIVFTEKFQIPAKYSILPDELLGTVSVFLTSEGEIVLYQTKDHLSRRNILKKYLLNNRDILFKKSKQYRLKYAFDPASSDAWMLNHLELLTDQLSQDETNRLARQQFKKELLVSFSKDEAVFKKEMAKKITQIVT